jgi:hypothetical protein
MLRSPLEKKSLHGYFQNLSGFAIQDDVEVPLRFCIVPRRNLMYSREARSQTCLFKLFLSMHHATPRSCAMSCYSESQLSSYQF